MIDVIKAACYYAITEQTLVAHQLK